MDILPALLVLLLLKLIPIVLAHVAVTSIFEVHSILVESALPPLVLLIQILQDISRLSQVSIGALDYRAGA